MYKKNHFYSDSNSYYKNNNLGKNLTKFILNFNTLIIFKIGLFFLKNFKLPNCKYFMEFFEKFPLRDDFLKIVEFIDFKNINLKFSLNLQNTSLSDLKNTSLSELKKQKVFLDKVYICTCIFVGIKILLSLILSLIGFFIVKDLFLSIIAGLTLAVLGFFIPDLILKRVEILKCQNLDKDLAFVIDLLNISILAGQNIYNSLKLILEKYNGSINVELEKFINAIDFGVSRFEAFNNFVLKKGTDNFKNLLFLLIQAEKYGGSVSEILKQKSKYLRYEEFQKMEQKSRRGSIMLLFPLVFLILPAFMLLAGGPLIFSIGGSFLGIG